jgi:hypothetical protein
MSAAVEKRFGIKAFRLSADLYGGFRAAPKAWAWDYLGISKAGFIFVAPATCFARD